MASDGTVTFSVWLDADDAEKELTTIKKKILDLQTDLAAQQKVKGGLEEKLAAAGVAADEAKAKLQELIATGASASAINAQKDIVKGLDKEFETAANAVDKQNAKIDETNAKLQAQEELYGQIQQQVTGLTTSTEEAKKSGISATDALATRVDKLTTRIAGLAKRVLFFSLFTRAFRAFRDYAGKALQTSDEFTAAVARLKGALATGFQPIFTAVLPALITLINFLAKAMAAIASFVSLLFGSTAEASAEAAANLYDEANALDAVGGGAGKAKGQLASFDEINQLNESGGGGGGGGLSSLSGKNIDFFGAIKSEMDEIEIYLSGALLALGAIFTFTGINIPLGLGLMVVGAVGLAKALSENWKTMPDKIKKALTNTMLILGTGALVIGAILTFSGANLPLGIGLMVAGAAALGTAAALNWEKIKTEMQGQFGAITAIASAGLLVVGLILTLSGVMLPLGISLIAAGAVGLAATAALNWDKIVQALQGPVGKIVAIASGALIVLGLILALSGIGLPLGIALIAAGAAGLVTVTAINWDAVKEKLQGAWEGIKNWWRTYVAPFFTLDYWTEKWDMIRQGLVSVWNTLVTWLQTAWNNLKSWWDGLTLKSPTIEGGTTVNSSGFSHSSGTFGVAYKEVPHLAAGAVIPPNREFLAVLGDQSSGTNIEAPLETITQALREALGSDGYGSITIPIYLDGQKIAENTVQRINRAARGSGKLGYV